EQRFLQAQPGSRPQRVARVPAVFGHRGCAQYCCRPRVTPRVTSGALGPAAILSRRPLRGVRTIAARRAL
ncbi:MAG: hypothetical protein ACRD0H_20625, partial [Actinomycetes bacterium]